MARWTGGSAALEAAQRWRDKCLIGEGSVLSDESLWVPQNVAYLDRYFVHNLDYGEGSFFPKLKSQLGPAPPEAKKLAAEMFWVMYLYLIPEAMRHATKRLQIKQVWEWSGDELPAAEFELGPALADGVGHPGTAYNTHRWREFLFFVVLLGEWYGFSLEERHHLLSKPWEFAAWVDGVDESNARQLRHILLFLLFPEQFERISTGYQKRDLVKSFREEFGEDPETIDYYDRTALDREILLIRETLEREHPTQKLDFYDSPLSEIWRPQEDEDEDEPVTDEVSDWHSQRFGDSRVWLVSAGVGGRAWGEFKREGLVAIGWNQLGDLDEYATKGEILGALKRDPETGPNPSVTALACQQFSREMQRGDTVIAKTGRSELLGYGVLTSDYRFDPSRTEYSHIRTAEWQQTGRWPLPEGRHVAAKTLTEATSWTSWLKMAFELMDGSPGLSAQLVVSEREPYTMTKALEDLFVEPGEFTAILDALGRKKNVILEGPPGVGKTFIAKRVAWSLIGFRDPDRVQMIQFHQSYAYEDFVQGWRPKADGGFELRDGVFYSFCRRAEQDPENPYVFIIDEINRGNLSKILGEAMLLLEADKRGREFAVPLTYSASDADRFSVPDNLHVLGLMNTADRSLAMVDYALRRRFGFVRLPPAYGNERFSQYLIDAGVEEDLVEHIVTRFSELNDEIRDDTKNLGPGFEIGHSFFCPQEGDEALDFAWYESVVRSEIEPLLTEYWFDQASQVERLVDRLLR